jgi:putative chitinase
MDLSPIDLKNLGCQRTVLLTPHINYYSKVFKMDSLNNIVDFFANLCHETLFFFYIEEEASGEAYEGRKDLGNTVKRDGVKFKGRGLGQTTGRKNYTALTTYTQNVLKEQVDFVKNPELLLQPKWAVLSAFFFWDSNKLYTWSDKGDFDAVCNVWNTGKPDRPANHLDRRREIRVKVLAWATKILEE